MLLATLIFVGLLTKGSHRGLIKSNILCSFLISGLELSLSICANVGSTSILLLPLLFGKRDGKTLLL